MTDQTEQLFSDKIYILHILSVADLVLSMDKKIPTELTNTVR